MGQEGVNTRAFVPQGRRAFLAGALGVATAFLVPALMANAATRPRQGTPARKSKAARRRDTARTGPRAAGRRALSPRGRQASGRAATSPPQDDALLARSLDSTSRSLSLYHLHTGERITVDYFVNGAYDPDCLRELSRVLRDHRTDEVHAIDPGTLDLLYAIRGRLESADALHIVCGYRSPLTNLLKFLSGAGVAERSYHITGQAIDFYVPRRPLRAVHEMAVAMRGGGVGYYPRSGFIHVDTGPLRYW
jgi:uncharacterized protein YcbK (DUF882 family)